MKCVSPEEFTSSYSSGGAEMTASRGRQGVARGMPGGRQGDARGTPGGRQGVATPASPPKSTTDAQKVLSWSQFLSFRSSHLTLHQFFMAFYWIFMDLDTENPSISLEIQHQQRELRFNQNRAAVHARARFLMFSGIQNCGKMDNSAYRKRT